jgi:hypothetical protein
MKSTFWVLLLLFCWLRADAAFKLDGDLAWEITEPRCTFTLKGSLQNNAPSGSVSGTVKMVLWATRSTYPSPGYIVGEYTLGQISGGYQFSDFSVRTSSKIPSITGTYHFTITIMEFTQAGWRNVLLVRTGTRSLVNGDFTNQKKWSIPNKTITPPPAKLAKGDGIKTTTKATIELNLLPFLAQQKSSIKITGKSSLARSDASGRKPAVFTYSVVQSPLHGKQVATGRLFADFAKAAGTGGKANTTYLLYFQGLATGIYKCTEIIGSRQDITWGHFSFAPLAGFPAPLP